jgi:predicted methyltransferase
MSAPRVSVIVPVPPGRQPTVAIDGLRALRATVAEGWAVQGRAA